MARVGGRNAVFAWVVGVLCVGALAGLGVLAAPLLPSALGWVQGMTGPRESAEPAPSPEDSEALTACAQLYPENLWMLLQDARDSALTPSQDAPTTTATSLVDALQLRVSVTCTWTGADGSVSTTLADAPSDTAALAAAALPPAGFACAPVQERIRCTRTDGDLVETIEAGDGRWLSTSESGWHPDDYVSRVADEVFAQ